ncbi:MAG: carboxypeptidase-like regulatory domain-containing protein, partial [Ignavibacteria bacterium]|nr:carboxypeptidase-like regulatory domain-containing protein [Ignavibacteria bacterium]
MKILVILFLILNLFVFGQEKTLNGLVRDAETEHPLPNANVLIIGQETTGKITDADGYFSITREFKKGDKLIISFVGYEDEIVDVWELLAKGKAQEKFSYSFQLSPKIIPSQTVLVEATVGKQGITPVTFDKIKRKDIEKNYTVYDIPKYLSDLPSTTFYSESGNAIGYNYISIRGFDQRRISVSINGIPQNDPEDHNVYWLDFPDLLASTELIQV